MINTEISISINNNNDIIISLPLGLQFLQLFSLLSFKLQPEHRQFYMNMVINHTHTHIHTHTQTFIIYYINTHAYAEHKCQGGNK